MPKKRFLAEMTISMEIIANDFKNAQEAVQHTHLDFKTKDGTKVQNTVVDDIKVIREIIERPKP